MRLKIETVEINDNGRAIAYLSMPWGDQVTVGLGDARYVCLPHKSRVTHAFAAALARFASTARFDSRGDDQHSYAVAKGGT